MKENDNDYISYFEINTKNITNNINVKKIKHINLAIKELNSWCDLFIERRNKEKEKKYYFDSLNKKMITNITDFYVKETKFFKDENEVKKMILYNWFAFLLRYRLPKYCDGKTLRKYRRELFNELRSGKLVTKKSIDILNKCFEKLKDI